MSRKLLITAALLSCLSGCASKAEDAPHREGPPPAASASPAPTATPKQTDPALESAGEEDSIQDVPSDEDRLQVRRAASDFAAAGKQGWQIEGVGTFAHSGNLYLVAVEMSKGTERTTVNLVARMFVAPDNSAYWRVEPMTPELMQFVSNVAERADGSSK